VTRIFMGTEKALLIADDAGGTWQMHEYFSGSDIQAITTDPLAPACVYVGAYRGMWRSDNGGATWQDLSGSLPEPAVMSIAVSAHERAPDGRGVVYIGTEPSAVYRSPDGGMNWYEGQPVIAMPSSPTWSFPPRPFTHHVRWLSLDPVESARLYACVENGALLRSRNQGASWADRTADGPHDTHTFTTHPNAPGRLYSAAGDGFMKPGRGYAESVDRGDTWVRMSEGLAHHYLYGMAVDAADPEGVLVSASPSPNHAHNPMAAEAHIYRKTGASWREVTEGLPEARGTMIHILAAHPRQSGVAFALCNHGLFRTENGGDRWTHLPMPWRDHYRFWHMNALAITE